MFVVLSKFAIANEEAIKPTKQAFKNRPHLVDQVKGFVRMDVLSPQEASNEIWLITYWQTKEDYQVWHSSPAYKQAHAQIPAGLKLVSHSAEIQFLEHLCS